MLLLLAVIWTKVFVHLNLIVVIMALVLQLNLMLTMRWLLIMSELMSVVCVCSIGRG